MPNGGHPGDDQRRGQSDDGGQDEADAQSVLEAGRAGDQCAEDGDGQGSRRSGGWC